GSSAAPSSDRRAWISARRRPDDWSAYMTTSRVATVPLSSHAMRPKLAGSSGRVLSVLLTGHSSQVAQVGKAGACRGRGPVSAPPAGVERSGGSGSGTGLVDDHARCVILHTQRDHPLDVPGPVGRLLRLVGDDLVHLVLVARGPVHSRERALPLHDPQTRALRLHGGVELVAHPLGLPMLVQVAQDGHGALVV